VPGSSHEADGADRSEDRLGPGDRIVLPYSGLDAFSSAGDPAGGTPGG